MYQAPFQGRLWCSGIADGRTKPQMQRPGHTGRKALAKKKSCTKLPSHTAQKSFKSEHQDHNPRKALILAPKYSASFKPLQTFSDCILNAAPCVWLVSLFLNMSLSLSWNRCQSTQHSTAPLHCCRIDCKKKSKSRPRSAFRALPYLWLKLSRLKPH